MSRTATIVLALTAGFIVGIPLGGRLMPASERAPAATTSPVFSAVPDAIGAQDISGPYEVVANWPKDLSTLPGHDKWTFGGARGIFAESPNRVYLLGGGELPNIPRPQTRLLSEIGPNVQFPLAGLPWRNANAAAPPGGGGSGQDPAKGMEIWRGAAPPYRELGVDSRWEHALVVVDAQGNIIEEWTQWDKMFKRPHAVYISPYDSQKHYAWGTVADFPGTLWGVHGMSTDQEGNLYVAEVDAGRFQKFRPRPGANPAYLIGKPVYSAWQ